MAKAKQVYTVEYISLQDGTEIEVKPLALRKLKRAQNMINEAINGKPLLDEDGEPVLDEKTGEPKVDPNQDDDALLNAFIETTLMVMSSQSEEKYRDSCKKFLDEDEGREALEDVIDQDSLYEIVRLSTGYDFLAVQKRMQAIMAKELNL